MVHSLGARMAGGCIWHLNYPWLCFGYNVNETKSVKQLFLLHFSGLTIQVNLFCTAKNIRLFPGAEFSDYIYYLILGRLLLRHG